MQNKKIVVTGGSGRFGSILKKNVGKNYIFPDKKNLNILNLSSIIKYLKKIKPKYLLHLAGFNPMVQDALNRLLYMGILKGQTP